MKATPTPMKKYVILHGHFYQPPREDPWTGLIELQSSAAPYSDWNRRITAECYAAGASSRILDGDGRILSIVNNYRSLSFNFGPTLLSWMEREAPETYGKIIEADRESRLRLGWGNAVAQAFNHTILPLDNRDDAELQIIWGLTDFHRRFGRKADGIWLPECGIDGTVLDILIEQGMKYVILSPWQAASVTDSRGRKTDLDGKPAPSDRPYLLSGSEGEIAAFFYHPGLASQISFGHLLRSREGLESALRSAFGEKSAQLVTVATDGEIYGHHEPYGDMCLAALIDHLGNDSDLVFTNYAAYLEDHPPDRRAELRFGEDGMGSSWSCSHGVGRWMRDCGCSTGGEEDWDQSWRGPLRDAFDELRDAAAPLWSRRVAQLTGDETRDVLIDYGNVLSGGESPESFASRRLGRSDAPNERRLLLENLEGARYLQFMYTSCGWFFSELSGLEPVQNMRYAYRATELLDPDGTAGLEDLLERHLKRARSNIPESGNGAELLRHFVIPTYPPAYRGAALFFWRNLYDMAEGPADSWGSWKCRRLTRSIVNADDGRLQVKGEIEYVHTPTGRDNILPYSAIVDGRLFCPEIEIGPDDRRITIPISAMPAKMRMEVQKTLLRRSEKKFRKFLGGQALIRLRDLKMVRELDLPLGASAWQTLELSLHYGPILALERLEKLPISRWPEALKLLDEILLQRDDYGLDTDSGVIENRTGRLISSMAEEMMEHCDEETIAAMVGLLEVIHNHGLRPLKPYTQNSVFKLLEHRFGRNGVRNTSECCGMSDESLLALSRMMNINPVRLLDNRT